VGYSDYHVKHRNNCGLYLLSREK